MKNGQILKAGTPMFKYNGIDSYSIEVDETWDLNYNNLHRLDLFVLAKNVTLEIIYEGPEKKL